MDYNELVEMFNGRNYKEDYQILLHAVRKRGSTVPPLVNAYMNLSRTMRYFGTCPDHGLPGTNGIGILITLKDINDDKRIRHMDSYKSKNPKFDRRRLFRIDMRRLPWWRNTTEEESRNLKELKGMSDAIHAERTTLRNQIEEIRTRRRRRKKGDGNED